MLPVPSRLILWERSDVPGFEWLELTVEPDGDRLAGVAILAWEGSPCRVEYAIRLDVEGRTRHVRVTSAGLGPRLELDLEADGAGAWRRDGRTLVGASSAVDVDLGFSPSTNSLPIRRLGLAVGERRDIEVAWVLFPGLDVELGRQSYERLDDRRWRYRSAGFEADLTVDEDGLVERYAEWRAIAGR